MIAWNRLRDEQNSPCIIEKSQHMGIFLLYKHTKKQNTKKHTSENGYHERKKRIIQQTNLNNNLEQ
jgi:hypothetical protein